MRNFIERIFAIVAASLLLCSVTFAWLFDTQDRVSQHLDVDFRDETGNRLYLGDARLKMEIYAYDEETGTYYLTDEPIMKEGIVPNQMVRFRIRFTNVSALPQIISLYASDILCKVADGSSGTSDLFAGKMYIGAAGGSGYNMDSKSDITYPDGWFGNVTAPDEVFICVGDTPASGSGLRMVPIYRHLSIPATGENRYVELNCTIWFDRNADSSFQDAEFTIGAFTVYV